MDEPFAIDVKELTKSFGGREVVRGVTLQLRSGRIYGFLGPNGSGKTTTLRMLSGLLTPDRGSGSCLGFDLVRQTRRIKERVGYMTQRFSLYGDLTVAENLMFIARIYALRNAGQVVAAIMRKLSLEHVSGHLAETLSGGWKQRLALAACMLHEPELLLLDEPTAGIDPKARRDFWDQLHALAQAGVTVLVATHYMDEAEKCHELAFMFDGRLMDYGRVEDVTGRAGLTTWVVEGAHAAGLETELASAPGVDIVTPFGDMLRVSGYDGTALDNTVAELRDRSPYVWRRGEPMLEDVFIALMKRNDHARN